MYTKQTKNAEQIVTAALAATGSTWIKKADLLSYMAARNISKEIINAAIVINKIVHFIDENGESFLTTSYFNAIEDQIAKNVMRLLYGSPCQKVDESLIRSLVSEFEETVNEGRKLHEHQVDGVIMVVNNNFSVLTGGPGTGKTTVLSAITYVLRKLNDKVKIVFTAPTGKAARRISESTGENASTLHKKLGIGYQETEGEPFYEDVLFIDESSMNDTSLTATLSKAMMNGRKIVFIGDVNQLPSVGNGAVLRDLIASNVVPVTMLTHTFRQDNSSCLYANICNVREGKPVFKDGKDFHPMLLDENCTEQEAMKTLQNIYAKEIEKYGKENVVVLLPYRKKGICSNALNNRLQRIANSERSGYRHYCKADDNTLFFMKHDLVMQLSNRDECANGDVGEVLDVSPRGVLVNFNDKEVLYSLDDLDQLCLAYAMTVHKSQGSEYKSVIVCMMNCHIAMLTRNLLYTGITRAKKECTVVYQQKAFTTAIATIAEASRITMLKEKLRTCYMQYKAVCG